MLKLKIHSSGLLNKASSISKFHLQTKPAANAEGMKDDDVAIRPSIIQWIFQNELSYLPRLIMAAW